MGIINDSARLIIKISVEKIGRQQTAKLYSIPFVVIDQYLLGIDQGTLTGREILRMEIARKQGKKITEKERYKGGRNR
jgi:hypothetical protein